MTYVSKAALAEQLKSHGETVPAKWTRPQMEARLWELQQEQGQSVQAIRKKQLAEMHKSFKNKSELRTYLELNFGVSLSSNETMKQLQARAYEELMKASPALKEDVMGFGKHSALEYQEVILKDPSYTDWCISTFMETGGQAGTANWRLKRYANWAQGIRRDPKSFQQEAMSSMTTSSAATSAWTTLTSPKPETTICTEEEMFSEDETEKQIQALENQIQGLRRQGKKGKTNPAESQWALQRGLLIFTLWVPAKWSLWARKHLNH